MTNEAMPDQPLTPEQMAEERRRQNPHPHVAYRAGDTDCPSDIKAPNGELHTLRCRVCGKNIVGPYCEANRAAQSQPPDIQPESDEEWTKEVAGLLDDLDEIARHYDVHEYGLPLHDYGVGGARDKLIGAVESLLSRRVAAERERIIAAIPGGSTVDPQWVCDMIRASAIRATANN